MVCRWLCWLLGGLCGCRSAYSGFGYYGDGGFGFVVVVILGGFQ